MSGWKFEPLPLFCAACIAESSGAAPATENLQHAYVLVNGTSLCVEHAQQKEHHDGPA